MLDRLADVIRARDASSVCGLNPKDERSNVSIHHDIHHNGLSRITFGSSGGSGLDILGTATARKLTSSRRNDTSSAMSSSHLWRGVSNGGSLTSRGSSWFDSVPSAYGGVGRKKGGDTRGGNNGADDRVAVVTAGEGTNEKRVTRSISATATPAAAPGTAVSTTDPSAAAVISTNVAATSPSDENNGGTRKDQNDNGSSRDGELRRDNGVSEGVSNGERSDKSFTRGRGVSETGSCVGSRSNRVSCSSRR